MAITVQTTGWVGLGFNSIGSMVGADIFMAWVCGGSFSRTGKLGQCLTFHLACLYHDQSMPFLSSQTVPFASKTVIQTDLNVH